MQRFGGIRPPRQRYASTVWYSLVGSQNLFAAGSCRFERFSADDRGFAGRRNRAREVAISRAVDERRYRIHPSGDQTGSLSVFPWQLEPSERRTCRAARNSSDRWLSGAAVGNCRAGIFVPEAHSRGRAFSPECLRPRRWQVPLSHAARVSIGFSLSWLRRRNRWGRQAERAGWLFTLQRTLRSTSRSTCLTPEWPASGS